jgi:dTMP kinase
MNKMLTKGKFIVFEGIDGSGKSTQVQLLAKKFHEQGYRVHVTCEPTRYDLGKLIREVFTGKRILDQRTVAALFVADRLEHLLNKEYGVLQYLDRGYIVISDRFYLSSFAYQAAFAPLEWLIKANGLAMELITPDLTIYLDADPEVSIARIKEGRGEAEMYETIDQLKAIKERYTELLKRFESKENIYSLVANDSVYDIADRIWKKAFTVVL